MKRALVFLFLIACGNKPPAVAPDLPHKSPCDGDPIAKEGDARSQRTHVELASDLEGIPIGRIDVAGVVSILPAEVIRATDLREGAPLTHASVARAIRSLYALGDVDDVEIAVKQDGATVSMRILVRERPKVGTILAPDVPEKTKDEIARALSVEPGKRFDAAEVWQKKKDIAQGMEARGARFDVRTVAGKNNTVDVCILVGDGGNDHIQDRPSPPEKRP